MQTSTFVLLAATLAAGLSSTAPLGAQPCTAPPAGLVAWWPGDGHYFDLVGGHNGTPSGAVGFSPGRVGQALNLAGSEDYVKVAFGGMQGWSEATLQAWIKPSQIVLGCVYAEYRTVGEYGRFWMGTDSLGRVYVAGRDTASGDTGQVKGITSVGTVPIDAWTHVVGVWKAGEGVRIYLNGELDNQWLSPALGPFTSTASVTVDIGTGSELHPAAENFQGAIDEVALFNRALSVSEIAALYAAGSAGMCKPAFPPPAGTVAWWPGDGHGSDLVGTNHGTLHGGTSYAVGKVGPAFSFAEAGDQVLIPASPSLDIGSGGGFSFIAWINPSDLSPRPLVEWGRIQNHNDSDYGVHLWMSVPSMGGGPGSLWANIKPGPTVGAAFSTSPGWLVAGQFQHVALTYDKTSGRAVIYVNGAVAAAQSLGGFTPWTALDLHLGARVSPGSAAFAGQMDEIVLCNRALSQTEIAALYAAGSAGMCKPAFPQPSGLIGWWRAEGNALDSAGSHHGDLTNGGAFAPGQRGQAFQLDGLDDAVLFPGTRHGALDLTNQQLSVSAWVNLASISQPFGLGHVIVGKYWTTSADGYQLQVFNGQLRLDLATNAQPDFYLAASQILPTNQWVHVAGTYDGSRARLYLNGAEIASAPLSGSILHNDYDLAIGNDNGLSTEYGFNGLLDEVMIYDRALSTDEVENLHVAQGGWPRLYIASEPGAVRLSWPGAADGYWLQATTDLLPGSWETVTDPPSLIGVRKEVVLPTVTRPRRFFRLTNGN